jgi:hypothetical protein
MFTPPNLASTGAPPKAMIASSRSSPVLIYAKIVSFMFLTCLIPKVHFVSFCSVCFGFCFGYHFEEWMFEFGI